MSVLNAVLSEPGNHCFSMSANRKPQKGLIKMGRVLSDNINVDFFGTDVSMERERVHNDGRIHVERKGTIQMLDERLDRVSFLDPKPRKDMIETFKEIRKLRSKSTHTVDDHRFDQIYFKEQRELICRAYEAVQTLRLIFANHHNTYARRVPDWLYKGEMW